MADRRQRAAVRVGEQAPRQVGEERGVGDRRARGAGGALAVIVVHRRARAVAGEVEHDEAVRPGVGAEVVAGEVEILRQRLAPLRGAGPVLADQRALVRALARVAAREAGAVARGEQQGRRGVAAEQSPERRLARGLAFMAANDPVRCVRGQQVGERRDQVLAAELRRGIVGVADGEHRQLARELQAAGLRRDHAARVRGVLGDLVEVQAADRVLHVELVLHEERQLLRRGDEQQVIGHPDGIGGTGPGAEAREELLLALAGPVAVGAAVDFEEPSIMSARLGAAQGQQRLECLGDRVLARRLGAVRARRGEHRGPAGLRQVVRVEPGLDAVMAGDVGVDAGAQVGEVIGVLRVGRRGGAAELAPEVVGAGRREQIGAGADIDAVEVHGALQIHGATLRPRRRGCNVNCERRRGATIPRRVRITGPPPAPDLRTPQNNDQTTESAGFRRARRRS
ncbi:hypothetical protein [Nannocystis pusilla]|uniref:hypothetical protein n=1 Tax=Nannocystis pusilla TaxID=889268 RepID=UPI003B7E1F4D